MKYIPSARVLLFRYATRISVLACVTSFLVFLGLVYTRSRAQSIADSQLSILARLHTLTALTYHPSDEERDNVQGLFALDYENLISEIAQAGLAEDPEWRVFQDAWERLKLEGTTDAQDNLVRVVYALTTKVHASALESLQAIGYVQDLAQTLGVIGLLTTLMTAFFLAQDLRTRFAEPIKELSEDLALRADFFKESLRFGSPGILEVDKLQRTIAKFWREHADYRKMNIERLEAESEKLRATVDAIDHAIMVLNSEETIIHVNKGFCELLMLPSKDIVGRNWNDLDSVTYNYVSLRKYFDEIDNEDNETIQLEVAPEQPKVMTHTGEAITLKTLEVFVGKKKNFVDSDGAEGSVLMLHQYSEEGAREALRQKVLLLVQGALKTPVQSLKVGIQLAISSLTNAEIGLKAAEAIGPGEEQAAYANRVVLLQRQVSEALRFLNIVKRSREHVETIARNLTSFEVEEFGSKEEQTDVAQFLGTCVDAQRLTAEEHSVKISFQSGEQVPIGTVDKEAMQVVIGNLLANAVSAAAQSLHDEEKRVALSVWDAAEFWAKYPPAQWCPSFVIADMAKEGQDVKTIFRGVICVVADSGPGVEFEIRENLFTPGLQGNRMKTGEKGGLGLAFAKEITESNEGFLWLSEAPLFPDYLGAQFVIFWPYADSAV